MIVYGLCTGTSASKYNIWLDIRQNSQSISGNTSNITVMAKLQRNDGYEASAYNLYEAQNSITIKVAGVTKLSGNITFDTRNSATVILGTWTGDVTHDSDGTYSETVSAVFTAGNTGLSGGSVSGTFSATTIPRASTLSLSYTSRNPTQDITATITSASTSFAHRITYSISSFSSVNTIAAGTTTHTFTIPQGWANAVTNSANGTVSVTLNTLSGSTVVGTKVYSFTLTIPNTSTYTPEFSIALTRVDNSVPSDWGIYVQSKSGVTVGLTGESYKYGASFKKAEVTVSGITKTISSLTSDVTFSPLNTSGEVSVSVKLTDSRGYSTTNTTSITVYEYTSPSAYITEAVRTDSEDNPDENGGYIKFTTNYTFSSCSSNNSAAVAVEYKEYSASAWISAERLIDVSGLNRVIGFCGSGALNSGTTYQFRFTVTDAFVSVSVTQKIGTAAIAFNIRPGGTGAAFGKFAETDNLLDIAYGVNIGGDLTVSGTCPRDLLWSSDTTLTEGNAVTLSGNLFDYRLAAFLTDYHSSSGAQVMLAAVYPAAESTICANISAASAYTDTSDVELYSLKGLYSISSGYTFTLSNFKVLNLAAGGITENTTYTGITRIWGIK